MRHQEAAEEENGKTQMWLVDESSVIRLCLLTWLADVPRSNPER